MTEQSPAKLTKKQRQITQVEQVVNQYARNLCAKEFNLPVWKWYVHLQTTITSPQGVETDGELAVFGGPVASINIKYPEGLDNINTLLRRAFNLIHNRNIVRSTEVVPFVFIQEFGATYRKFVRKEFGDESEILPDLLPRRRLKVTRKHYIEVTVTDKVTGITSTLRAPEEKRQTWSLEHDARTQVSRAVKQLEDSQVTELHTGIRESTSSVEIRNNVDPTNNREHGAVNNLLPIKYEVMQAIREQHLIMQFEAQNGR